MCCEVFVPQKYFRFSCVTMNRQNCAYYPIMLSVSSYFRIRYRVSNDLQKTNILTEDVIKLHCLNACQWIMVNDRQGSLSTLDHITAASCSTDYMMLHFSVLSKNTSILIMHTFVIIFTIVREMGYHCFTQSLQAFYAFPVR